MRAIQFLRRDIAKTRFITTDCFSTGFSYWQHMPKKKDGFNLMTQSILLKRARGKMIFSHCQLSRVKKMNPIYLREEKEARHFQSEIESCYIHAGCRIRNGKCS
jgi:hypothetical protein